MLKRSCLITILITLFLTTYAFGSTPDLLRDGNTSPRDIDTQSGKQFFIANNGFYDGANKIEIFGKRPTTLWNDDRRTDCYEHSIRLMAQMPVANGLENISQVQYVLNKLGFGADALKGTANALNALQTNYVDGSTVAGDLSNKISEFLRNINPKTIDGVKVPCTNLKHFANALHYAAAAYTIADFAVGAALQEALAGDLALGRLALIENIFKNRERNGIPVDMAIFRAIDRVRLNLVRSEDYYGALMTEITDRKSELVQMGLVAGVRFVQKDAVKLLTKYFAHSMGARAAATKASSVAGLWAFSLIATYKTIDAVLDQHKKGQVSVTSATMAYIIDAEIRQKRIDNIPVIRALQYQAEYSYYDQIVKISSGILPAFHDLLSIGGPYKDAKEHFANLRERTRILILREMDTRLNEVTTIQDRKISNSLDMEFVYIQPGTFTMGSPRSEPFRVRDETQHQVTLSRPFYMQTTEVTQGQWKSLMGSNPSHFKSCGDNCPVENVSWKDVQEFIHKLNRHESNKKYRLPTEAEWEYAARAGSTEPYTNGPITNYKHSCHYEPNLDAIAWYCFNSDKRTHPVAQKAPNNWGLYDVLGNVAEFVTDWYGKYSTSPITDPTGPTSGPYRVMRGGSYGNYPDDASRLSFRNNLPENGGTGSGFRLVREP